MPLDEDVTRLAKGKNLATVVTLMPNGQPQALLTWVDADDEHVLVNTEPQRQRARNVARDPRITVLIRGDDPYDWAEVRGHVAETVTGDEARRHIDDCRASTPGRTTPRRSARTAAITRSATRCLCGLPILAVNATRDAGRRRSCGAADPARLAHVFRHLEGVADRPPDGLGVYPVRQSALDRAPGRACRTRSPWPRSAHTRRRTARSSDTRIRSAARRPGYCGPGPDLRGG